MSKLSKWMKNNREAKAVKRKFIYNAKHALWSVLDFFVSDVEFMDISLYTSIYYHPARKPIGLSYLDELLFDF